jgi:putative serine protease PepD
MRSTVVDMNNPENQSGLNTPPFAGYRAPAQGGDASFSGGSAPSYTAGPSYAAADFPAPPGVRPVTQTHPLLAPPTAKPKGRLAALLVAASLSAVIGAGAGIGSSSM